VYINRECCLAAELFIGRVGTFRRQRELFEGRDRAVQRELFKSRDRAD
jgi:hypothetical protein